MRFCFLSLVLAVLLAAAGCNQKAERAPVLGESYAGPSSLSLRQEINPRAQVVATAAHGEKLFVVQRRRRFTKVRTGAGLEGWTEDGMLLSAQQMENLRKLSEVSKAAPSQGIASTYEVLNVHIEPERLSPSFLQIKEGEKFDVIGHKVTPRNPPAPPKPPPVPRVRSTKKSKKEKASKEVPPPPMPAAPSVPRNWLDLSRTNFEEAPAQLLNTSRQAPKAPSMDDWSLVRTKSGQSGWVLTRRVYMAIPDEVAQYAEGRRITSYFAAGESRDEEEGVSKRNWVWTTTERGLQPYDFDSFRVFTWNSRKRRYETAHIERNVRGFFPVLQHPVAPPRSSKSKAPADAAKLPGFSVLIEKKDGQRYRRSYAFIGNVVRFSEEERVTGNESAPGSGSQQVAGTPGPGGAKPAESFYARMVERVGEVRKRWLGR